ncbi:uncharacterized protein LOC129257096 isoform X1 [Lytechinus pictus]|uniref:uncharacterized protein LOC129257096 isoform X1 n=1 Tax=Lytechinus pictus TaxID=7653 RepID=UPI0030BA1166
MKLIVLLSAHYQVKMILYLFILSSSVYNIILADSNEHESAALHLFPGAIKRSSAVVSGCHCNCTSNNNDALSNIGFFPCHSSECIKCAPTNYDVCVSAFTDNEGNQDYGLYVCLTDQQQSRAMCLYSLQIPYFICEKTDNRYIECQYERGNEESICTFRAPNKVISDGCYPLAPSCPDNSRVCCESARECSCLSNIFAPSSDICLQKSVANGLWGSCECDVYSGSPVCGACGECDDGGDEDSPSDDKNRVSGTNNTGDGGGGDIGGFEESHQDPMKIAGVVVPIVAIIVFLVVGMIVVWRTGGIPKCMKRRCVCTCEETGSMTELPVKRSPSGPDHENPYEIEPNEEPHFYAGVHNIGSTDRSNQDGPLTNAQEDTNGYLWYRGEESSKKLSSNLDQNKKDPGDGLVYYEVEETKETPGDKKVTDTTPEYLEFDVDDKMAATKEETKSQGHTVHSTEQAASHASPNASISQEDCRYGKLDRSPNKYGHLKSKTHFTEEDEYGHLEPVKGAAGDNTCLSSAETVKSTENPGSHASPNGVIIQQYTEYGKLDRSPNKSGHLKYSTHPPADDEYGHLQPVKGAGRDTADCPPAETVQSTEQPRCQVSPNVDMAKEDCQYGKLDRSPNKSGHLQYGTHPTEDDEYGHLEPIKGTLEDTTSCQPTETYQALERSPVVKALTENLQGDSGTEYGQLDMTEVEQHTAPSSATPQSVSLDPNRTRTPDDMPPSSEEVYGIL